MDRAKVGDVIEHGQDIPANVSWMADADARRWKRTPADHWHTAEDAIEACETSECYEDSTWKMKRRYPLSVVEVDPEPQPVETMCATCGERRPANGTDVCWRCEQINALKPQPAHPLGPITIAQRELLDEIASIVGVRPHEDLAEAVRQLVAKPAESGPLVLTLPEVPAEAVALIGRDQQGEEVRLPIEDGRVCVHPGVPVGLGDCLDTWGPLTVEMPPPRKPRTWQRYDLGVTDLPQVVDVKGDGRWRLGTDGLYGRAHRDTRYSLSTLATLGEITEVFG